jgi:hypothetical protein
MSLIHWLLNLSCFGVMLIPGRPEALAVAHFSGLAPLATAPVTAVVMYLYSYWLMSRADWLPAAFGGCAASMPPYRFVNSGCPGLSGCC